MCSFRMWSTIQIDSDIIAAAGYVSEAPIGPMFLPYVNDFYFILLLLLLFFRNRKWARPSRPIYLKFGNVGKIILR